MSGTAVDENKTRPAGFTPSQIVDVDSFDIDHVVFIGDIHGFAVPGWCVVNFSFFFHKRPRQELNLRPTA